MFRLAAKIISLVIILAVALCAILYVTAKPVTEREAKQLAIQRLQRSGEQLRFDASVFVGPTMTHKDQIRVLVSVAFY